MFGKIKSRDVPNCKRRYTERRMKNYTKGEVKWLRIRTQRKEMATGRERTTHKKTKIEAKMMDEKLEM